MLLLAAISVRLGSGSSNGSDSGSGSGSELLAVSGSVSSGGGS